MKPLDELDWAILAALQADARLSMAELARRVHLSGPATADRVRRLERTGVITGYTATVDLAALGRDLVAYLRISAAGEIRDRVARLVADSPEILECHRGTGNECFILKVAVTGVRHLEHVIDRVTTLGPVTTTVILSSPMPARAVQPLPTHRGISARQRT